MADDRYERLKAAVLSRPDVDRYMAAVDAYAGSGDDWAVARAFVAYRDRLVKLAKEGGE